MTRIINDPETFARTALEGFAAVHSRIVRPVRGGVVRSTAAKADKVAIVVGGGSGHYPAFIGYVGPGLADGAVAGDIFASPSASAVQNVSRAANHGGGVILGFGNYAGDVLHFGLAAERLRAEGIDTRIVLVTDDIASASKAEITKRRGIAGDLNVFKIAGAAAEEGHDIDEVERLTRHANDRTRSFGVAFAGCTLPGADHPLFTVPDRSMGVGLGIHGEPGIDEVPMASARDLAALLVDRLLTEAPDSAGTKVAAVLNGLGSTGLEELFVLWTEISARLTNAGLELVAPEVGMFVSSLDMSGCSLTLTWLDADLERLWLAPCDVPAIRRGAILPTDPDANPWQEQHEAKATYAELSPPERQAADCVATAIEHVAAKLRDAEDELGRIDAIAGDGDHGMGMARGSNAAATAARAAAKDGAPAAAVLAAAANAWADRAGGSSGAIWGVGLLAWSTKLKGTIDAKSMAEGARAAHDGITRLGGAKPGDKTLVDVLGPFVETLEAEVGKGQSLSRAWDTAVEAADRAADATKDMTPKIGRARPLAERSRGHRDAGAVSLAMCVRVVGQLIKETASA
jgi:dihydroxyacetone kinase